MLFHFSSPLALSGVSCPADYSSLSMSRVAGESLAKELILSVLPYSESFVLLSPPVKLLDLTLKNIIRVGMV